MVHAIAIVESGEVVHELHHFNAVHAIAWSHLGIAREWWRRQRGNGAPCRERRGGQRASEHQHRPQGGGAYGYEWPYGSRVIHPGGYVEALRSGRFLN